MEIRKKRVGDLAIVVIDSKIYNRSGVDDKLWIDICDLCEDILQNDDVFFDFEEGFDSLMDLLVPERIKVREEEILAKETAIKESQLELDFDKRMKKAKRIADISGLFEYDDEGITYLTGFKHPMPKILVEALLDAHYNPTSKYTVDSLVNFWKYLLLNPDKHVRKELFQWINTGNFALTEEGNIIAYRNVDVKKAAVDKKFEDFVSQQWGKVKKWKKSPKNYSVVTITDEELCCVLTEKIPEDNIKINHGTLSELYADNETKENATVYTDQHTHSMTIKMGESVKLERSKCDNSSNSSCSSGLHAKSSAHGINFGSDVVVMLVNPWNVVAVPTYDNSKFRCCEYLPVAKGEVKDYKIVEFESGTYDIPYNGLDSLAKLLETKSLKELQESGEISTELESDDFEFVMTKAREVINKRVVEID